MSEQKRQTNFGLSSGIGVSPVLGSNFAATGNQQRSTCNTPPIRVGPCLSVVQGLQPATSAIPAPYPPQATPKIKPNHTESHLITPKQTIFQKKHDFYLYEPSNQCPSLQIRGSCLLSGGKNPVSTRKFASIRVKAHLRFICANLWLRKSAKSVVSNIRPGPPSKTPLPVNASAPY